MTCIVPMRMSSIYTLSIISLYLIHVQISITIVLIFIITVIVLPSLSLFIVFIVAVGIVIIIIIIVEYLLQFCLISMIYTNVSCNRFSCITRLRKRCGIDLDTDNEFQVPNFLEYAVYFRLTRASLLCNVLC